MVESEDRRYIAEKITDIPSGCLMDEDWFETLGACLGVKCGHGDSREDIEDYRRDVFNRIAELVMPPDTVYVLVRSGEGDQDGVPEVKMVYSHVDDCKADVERMMREDDAGFAIIPTAYW